MCFVILTVKTSFCLFLECPFSSACGNSVSIPWNLNLQPLDMISARTTFGSPIFRDLIITTCWIIWKTRNDVSFDGEDYNLCRWKFNFKEELGLVCIKAKQKIRDPLVRWCENSLMFLSFFLALGAW